MTCVKRYARPNPITGRRPRVFRCCSRGSCSAPASCSGTASSRLPPGAQGQNLPLRSRNNGIRFGRILTAQGRDAAEPLASRLESCLIAWRSAAPAPPSNFARGWISGLREGKNRLWSLEQPASIWMRISCSSTLESINFTAFNRSRLKAG